MTERGSFNFRQTAGFVLCRIVVPLWVLAGAVFKLVEHTPRLLPEKTVLEIGKSLESAGFSLYAFLATLIAIEFVAVSIMFFVARLARPVAIFVLSVFCAVLIGEMARGNVVSCGCLGAASPPPYVMLIIDGLLLAGVLFLPPRAAPGHRARWPVPAAAAGAVTGIAASFLVVLSAGKAPAPPPPPPNGAGNGGTSPPAQVRPDQGWWVTPPDVSVWVGKRWDEIPLLQFMDAPPEDMDAPLRYVVFFSRTCDHCLEMFERDLSDPALGRLTSGVEVPDSKDMLTSPDAWPMPATEVELGLSLPLGYDWIMTTPVCLRIENGVVTCAQEGGHEECYFGSDE